MSTIDIIQTVFLVLGFTLAAYQGWSAAKTSRSLTYSSMYQRLDTLNGLIIENYEVLRSSAKEHAESRKPNWIDRPADVLLDMVFTLCEEAFVQRTRYRLLDDDHWAAWDRLIRTTLCEERARARWDAVGPDFQEAFQKYMGVAMQGAAADAQAPG